MTICRDGVFLNPCFESAAAHRVWQFARICKDPAVVLRPGLDEAASEAPMDVIVDFTVARSRIPTADHRAGL